MSSLKNKSGFTTLEILVVTIIIGIVAALGIAPMRSFIAATFSETTAKKIQKGCNLAKIRAFSDPNLHTGIFLDTTGFPDSVYFFFDNDKNSLYTRTSDRLLLPAVEIPNTDTLKIASGFPETIIFRGDGSAKASANFTINSPKKRASTLTILASTGKIILKK